MSEGCGRCSDLEARVEELESVVDDLETVLEALDLPGVTIESNALEDFRVGSIPVGRAIKAKTSETDVIGLFDRFVETDTGVSLVVDREAMLPIHAMWADLEAGREDNIPSDSARRGARLFEQLFRRAAGDHEPKVAVTDGYYVMDSRQARDVLTEADDITDGGVSKTVGRAMKAVQRYTKRADCECSSIGACNHGLVVFDDAGGTNQLRVEKEALNAYGEKIQGADDDGEQPSEAPYSAETNGSVEAVDAALDDLTRADQVRDRVSDTVVSNLESEASELPILPDD